MAEGMANAVQIAVHIALCSSYELAAILAKRVNSPDIPPFLELDFVSRQYVVRGAASLFPAVYDDVIQAGDSGNDSVFPYIVIGSDSILDMSTDTSSGGDINVTIDVWSRYDGKRETKRIQAAIYRALHRASLKVPDHEFIGCDFDQEQPVTLDPDGHTYHGVSSFRVLIDEPGYGN